MQSAIMARQKCNRFALTKILKEEKEEEFRVVALYALGEVGDAAVPISVVYSKK